MAYMEIYQNYLERLIEASTDADAGGGSGGAGLPTTTGVPSGYVLKITQDPAQEDAVLTIRPYEGLGTPPNGGTWNITFDGDTTTPLNLTPGFLVNSYQSALEALPDIGAGNVSVSGAMADAEVVVTFIGDMGGEPILAARMTVNGTNLTGDSAPYTPIVEQTAPGAVGGAKTVAWAPDEDGGGL